MADSRSQPLDVRLKLLEQFILNPSKHQGLSYEALVDVIEVLHNELSSSNIKRERHVTEFLEWARPFMNRISELRVRKSDFDLVKVIGRGAFGEVGLVQKKGTGTFYAMKTLSKWDMIARSSMACFREERDVLVRGDRRWITNLHFAFQDSSQLYLVMDYYPGNCSKNILMFFF